MAWQRWGEGGGMIFSPDTLGSRDHIVLADNLTLLRFLPSASADLIYIDPPFGTGKRRIGPEGSEGPEGYDDRLQDPRSFVEWLAPRLAELWRILSDNGNFVIHLDPRAIHHVRLWCDQTFGASRWENEIIWHYTGGGRSKTRFSRKHDVLLWYSKGPGRVFNIDSIREPYEPTSGYAKGGIVSKKGKKYMPHPSGKPADDVWDVSIVNPLSSERTAYPTQKPLKLLERIVGALSIENALVCDVFSGSGTTALACRTLNRRFICCDSNPDALGVTLERLASADPSAPPPAVISYGLYRLGFSTAETARGIARRFTASGLRLPNDPELDIVLPSWRKSSNPPFPLDYRDAIVHFRGAVFSKGVPDVS